MSLLLWYKMVAVCCFIWPLALRLWSVSQAVSLKLEFIDLKKRIYVWPPVSVLLQLMLYCILYGLVLFQKGDFLSRKMFLG